MKAEIAIHGALRGLAGETDIVVVEWSPAVSVSPVISFPDVAQQRSTRLPNQEPGRVLSDERC